jgi:hypothetical protein
MSDPSRPWWRDPRGMPPRDSGFAVAMRRRLPLLIGLATAFLLTHGLVSLATGEPVRGVVDLVFAALGVERFLNFRRSDA